VRKVERQRNRRCQRRVPSGPGAPAKGQLFGRSLRCHKPDSVQTPSMTLIYNPTRCVQTVVCKGGRARHGGRGSERTAQKGRIKRQPPGKPYCDPGHPYQQPGDDLSRAEALCPAKGSRRAKILAISAPRHTRSSFPLLSCPASVCMTRRFIMHTSSWKARLFVYPALAALALIRADAQTRLASPDQTSP